MPDAFKEALLELFSEAYTGPNHAYTWFFDNKPGSGLFGTLAPLSAEAASEEGPSSTTIAAHTEHLRWSLGEVPEGRWSESWSVRTVDVETWHNLRAELCREYDTLLAAMNRLESFSDPQFPKGMLALVPHAAYHLGAIRQMVA